MKDFIKYGFVITVLVMTIAFVFSPSLTVFCFVFGIALVVIAHVLYPEETKRFLKKLD